MGQGVTIDEFWINDRIYRNTHTHTHTHTLVPAVTSVLPLLGIGFHRRMFPLLWVPELSPATDIRVSPLTLFMKLMFKGNNYKHGYITKQ
jgi:hypothetical protein